MTEPIKILYADDDDMMLTLVSKSLIPRGIRVFTAKNGKEALDLALKEKFDIFLIDLTMPIMSGFEFLKKIKSYDHLSHIPVVILTGDKRDHSVLNCLKFGAADYIVKPLDVDKLHARITQLTEQQQVKKQSDDQPEEKTGIAQKKVLLIDFDPFDCKTITTSLKNIGFPENHIFISKDAETAISSMTEHRPDIIMLDPYLPTVGDGFVLIGRIQKNPDFKKIPIILISQFEIPLRYLNIFQIHPNEYIMKPISNEVLKTFIENASALPNFENRRLGDYLLENNYINMEQFQLALIFQHQMSCQKLNAGALALIKRFMTIEEVAGLYPIFELSDEQFLELALSGDFLNEEQVAEIKSLKNELSLPFGQVLVQLGFIRQSTLNNVLQSRKTHRNVALNQRELEKATSEVLIEKIRTNQSEEALKIISDGANTELSDNTGVTPLMLASSTGNKQVVQVLLAHNAKLDQVNRDRWTALHFAVFNKHIEIVTMLLDKGAPLDINDYWGRSIFDLAKETGKQELVWILNKAAENMGSD